MKHEFGVSVIMNSISGQNCSDKANISPQHLAERAVACVVYNAIVDKMSGGTAVPMPCMHETSMADLVETEGQPAVVHMASLASTIDFRTTPRHRAVHRSLHMIHKHQQYRQHVADHDPPTPPAVCKGSPIAAIAFVADGTCRVSPPNAGPIFYYQLAPIAGDDKAVNFTKWNDKACTGTPIMTYAQSLDTCSEVATPTGAYDILWVYNATSHIVLELVWQGAVSVDHCAWSPLLPTHVPSPAPTIAGLLRQTYSDPGCDPKTKTGVWTPASTDTCQPYPAGGYYNTSCSGTTVYGHLGCTAGCGTCSINVNTTLGDCLAVASPAGKIGVRFILVGPKATC
jgi:hypothetical protein